MVYKPLLDSYFDNHYYDVGKFIKSLNKINNYNDSLSVFKQIYNRHTPIEWLNTDRLLDYSNSIARYRPDLLPVGIRLNVQINLFLRTIHRFDKNKLDLIYDNIGCFGLTEKSAGVLSGLHINTFYRYENNKYILEPHIDDYKNWISQGMMAEWILIFAKNKLNKNIGIFLCKFSDIVNSIEREYIMGPVVCNYLDVAKIKIINPIILDKNQILEDTIDINKNKLLNGIYHGRWMISESILWAIYGLIEQCEETMKTITKLSIHKDDLLSEKCTIYTNILKMKHNRKNIDNIEIVNSFKILSVQMAIDSYVKISCLFGSHILNYPLKYDDILLNKIAEGDIDVLRLSLIYHDSKNGIFCSNIGLRLLINYFDNNYILHNKKYLADRIICRVISKL